MSNITQLLAMINAAKDTWSHQEFLKEAFQNFMSAVQQNAERVDDYPNEAAWIAAGSPTWNMSSEFADWLNETAKFIREHRIPENRKRMKDASAPTGVQSNLMKFSKEINFNDEKEMEGFEKDKIFYEYFDWDLHKQLETIKLYLDGKIELSEKDIALSEIEKEVATQFADKLGIRPKSPIISSLDIGSGIPGQISLH